MENLDEARAKINAVDRQMAQLFCERMDAVREVAAYKKARGLPVLDAAREEAVVQKNLSLVKSDAYTAFYEDFIRHEMALSRAFQAQLLGEDTVAYQGVPGAFAHIALRRLFTHITEKACATWDNVFDAVRTGQAAYGVVPFENSSAGDVSDVLDLCYATPEICVCKVYDLPVRQNLLCVPGASLADIKTVVSHPQGLHQCAAFLKGLRVETREMANTAAAARYVANTGDVHIAAIASRETAALYHLDILMENVNTSRNNTTRFIVISKKMPTCGNRFSLLFTVEHEAGMLARVIATMGELGYNMESIKSRPMPQVSWEYYFYTEIVGTPCEALLTALQKVCKSVRILGVYTKDCEEV